MTIDADLKAIANGKNFAALSTIASDGQPRTHIMWIDADDEHVIFNTDVGRAKFRDVERDPRVTITIFNAENPYQFVEARGTVTTTITGDDARDHIDSLAKKYMGADEYPGDRNTRVVVKMTPLKVHKNGY